MAKKTQTTKPAKAAPDLVVALADLLDERGLAEIEYIEGNKTVRLSRVAHTAPIAAAPAPAAAPASAPAPAPAASASAETGKADEYENHPGAVTSPMVGTAYVAPEPGAPAFIKEGDSVTAGQTLVIVEAMKVMNPIAAPRAGKVTKILISDAQPVEYGQALVILE